MFQRLTLMVSSQIAEATTSVRQEISSASANRDQSKFNHRNSRSRQLDRSQSRDNDYCWHHRNQFLVDTGADVCVFPRSPLPGRRKKTAYEFFAENESTIATFGSVSVSLNLGLRRDFS